MASLARKARGARKTRLEWPPLIALGLVGVIAVVAVWPTKPLHDGATIIASRPLRFVERADSSMLVIDADTGLQAGLVKTVKDGFVPGVLHGIDVIRKRYGVDPSTPYRVTEMTDGRVLLIDPPTHEEIDLESFGRGNAASFSAYLHSQEVEVK